MTHKKIMFRILTLLCLICFMTSTTLATAQSDYQVTLNTITAEPLEGMPAYTVTANLSVVNKEGIPVTGLQKINFNLSEDGELVEIDSIEEMENTSNSLVLVMDISGSMVGQGIIDARNAGSNFLMQLDADDRSSVISFADKVEVAADFSDNHQRSSDAVQKLTAIDRTGTCLFDAAYKAVEMAANSTVGKRAVILFTDGKDETLQGNTCSVRTIQDVIDLAKVARTPVYTLGVGWRVQEQDLKRLAATTGGSYYSAAQTSGLEDLFTKVFNQLNQEYKITFTSRRAPGSHNLAIEVDLHGQKLQSVVPFTLPNLPTTITFNSPKDNEKINGVVPIKVAILTQGSEISRVEFGNEGVVFGKDVSEPYEIDLDTSKLPTGIRKIEAVAIGKNGEELARVKVMVEIVPAADVSDSDEPVILEGVAGKLSLFGGKNTLFLLAGLLAIALFAIVLWILNRKKFQAASYPQDDFKLRDSEKFKEAPTMDEIDLRGVELGGALLATLTVIESNDESMLGKEFKLSHFPAQAGRNQEECEIGFNEVDRAVSRRHALFETRGQAITIKDLGSKFGTQVNGISITNQPQLLKNDDMIRLGTKVVLRFNQIPYFSSEDPYATQDNLDFGGQIDDRTRDAYEL